MTDPIDHGLKRHYEIIQKIASLTSDPEECIRIARMIDELVAAVVVETLERCRTEAERLAELQKLRAGFESRWAPSSEQN